MRNECFSMRKFPKSGPYMYILMRWITWNFGRITCLFQLPIRLKKIQEKKKIQREKAEREKKSKGVKPGEIVVICIDTELNAQCMWFRKPTLLHWLLCSIISGWMLLVGNSYVHLFTDIPLSSVMPFLAIVLPKKICTTYFDPKKP